MKNQINILKSFIAVLALFCLISTMGCGVAITSDSAKFAVDDAKSAYESAKSSQADVYSKDNLKKAERLLNEAENSLSRNRWQRAYTLAKKAGQSAQIAEQESKEKLGEESVKPISKSITTPDSTIVPKSPEIPTSIQQGIDIPDSALSPQLVLPSTQTPKQGVSVIPPSVSMPELQNRIQAAFQALQSAQNSIQSARLLMVKIQVDMGLLMMDTNIQLLQKSGATPETINIIKSMYAQAQQSSIAGNYDNALRILDQINAYIRALFVTVQ